VELKIIYGKNGSKYFELYDSIGQEYTTQVPGGPKKLEFV
jgi:hypothetical protein